MCRQRQAGLRRLERLQRPLHLRWALLPRQSPQAQLLETPVIVVETPAVAAGRPVAAVETPVVVGAHHLRRDFTLVSWDCSLGLATLRQAMS